MSAVHAGPVHDPIDGECTWRFHFEEVDLYCTELAIPGEPWLCASHLVELAARARQEGQGR